VSSDLITAAVVGRSALEAEHLTALDRNCRFMELARAEGVELELSPTRCGELRIWRVPAHWVERVGYMAALVR
jgi:hypothetical protein